jgi:hypothetical protein
MQEAEIGWTKASQGETVSEILISTNKLGIVVCTCDLSYIEERYGQEDGLKPTQAKMQDPLAKRKIKARRIGGVSQVTESLPSKCKFLSSNQSITKT